MGIAARLRSLAPLVLGCACATPAELPAVAPSVPASVAPLAVTSMRPIQPEMLGNPANRLPTTVPVERVPPLVRIQRVEARLDAGETPAALVTEATTVATELPESAVAQRLLAVVLDESGDPTGALLAYRRAAALEFHAPSLRRQATLEAAAGDPASAISTGKLLLARDPDDAGTHLTLAGLYEGQGDLEAAERAWTEVLRLRPDVPSSLRKHADLLEKLGRVKDAKAERAAADRLEKEDAADRGASRRLRALPASRR